MKGPNIATPRPKVAPRPNLKIIIPETGPLHGAQKPKTIDSLDTSENSSRDSKGCLGEKQLGTKRFESNHSAFDTAIDRKLILSKNKGIGTKSDEIPPLYRETPPLTNGLFMSSLNNLHSSDIKLLTQLYKHLFSNSSKKASSGQLKQLLQEIESKGLSHIASKVMIYAQLATDSTGKINLLNEDLKKDCVNIYDSLSYGELVFVYFSKKLRPLYSLSEDEFAKLDPQSNQTDAFTLKLALQTEDRLCNGTPREQTQLYGFSEIPDLANINNDPYTNIFGQDRNRFKPLETAFQELCSLAKPDAFELALEPNVVTYDLSDLEQAKQYLNDSQIIENDILNKGEQFIDDALLQQYSQALSSFASLINENQSNPFKYNDLIYGSLQEALSNITTQASPKWIQFLQTAQNKKDFVLKMEKVKAGWSLDPYEEDPEQLSRKALESSLKKMHYHPSYSTLFPKGLNLLRISKKWAHVDLLISQIHMKLGIIGSKAKIIEENLHKLSSSTYTHQKINPNTQELGKEDLDLMLTLVVTMQQLDTALMNSCCEYNTFAQGLAIDYLKKDNLHQALNSLMRAADLSTQQSQKYMEIGRICSWIETKN